MVANKANFNFDGTGRAKIARYSGEIYGNISQNITKKCKKILAVWASARRGLFFTENGVFLKL